MSAVSQAIAQQIQAHEWAVQIAFSRHYVEVSGFFAAILAETKISTFTDLYREEVLWAILDVVATAGVHADVQMVDTPYTMATGLVAYGIQDKDFAAVKRAAESLEQGFGAVGIKSHLLFDLTGESTTCCVVDPDHHDPAKIVARMKAPVVRHQGRLYRRR